MLGGRKLLPATRTVDLTHHPVGPAAASARSAMASSFPTAWWTMPGWSCSTRSMPPSAAPTSAPAPGCIRADRRDEWELVLNARGRREVATARVLVNAAGPWIGEVADTVIRRPLPAPVRLVKGSHIVVPPALRARLRLSVAGRRQARGIRAAFCAGFHFDRHHRRELRRRSQFAGARPRTRSSISARR